MSAYDDALDRAGASAAYDALKLADLGPRKHRPTRTQILSVHYTRRAARKRERLLTEAVNGMARTGIQTDSDSMRLFLRGSRGYVDWPTWARGVRVEKAGRLSWAVTATKQKGH